MYLVTKKSENNQITYFIANNLSQALEIYQREKKPLADKYGTKKGYVWDNRLLENGEKVETVSSFKRDTATLSVSTKKKEGDLDFYLKIHELSGQSCIVIDERNN